MTMAEFDEELTSDKALKAMVGTMYKFTKKSDTEYEIKSLAKNKGSYDEYFTEDSVTSIKDGNGCWCKEHLAHG